MNISSVISMTTAAGITRFHCRLPNVEDAGVVAAVATETGEAPPLCGPTRPLPTGGAGRGEEEVEVALLSGVYTLLQRPGLSLSGRSAGPTLPLREFGVFFTGNDAWREAACLLRSSASFSSLLPRSNGQATRGALSKAPFTFQTINH